jgi:hypothetical protein
MTEFASIEAATLRSRVDGIITATRINKLELDIKRSDKGSVNLSIIRLIQLDDKLTYEFSQFMKAFKLNSHYAEYNSKLHKKVPIVD